MSAVNVVRNEAGTVSADLVVDDDGNWSGSCGAGDWVSEPGRRYDLRDIAEEAHIHMRQAHR